MGRTLQVARVVFANQLKSLWRSHGPGRLRRSPSLFVVVAQYALALTIVLNYAFVVRGGLGGLAKLHEGVRPPESGLLNLAGDVLSAALTTYLLTHYFSRDRLVSIPPDLEFLLYQPLRPREVYGGMTLGLYAYFAVVSAPWLTAVVLLTAPWFGFILVYAFTYVMSADPVLFIASSVLRRSNRRGTALTLSVTYVAVGVIHSVVETLASGRPAVSPLLTHPVRGPYELTLRLCDSIGIAGVLAYVMLVTSLILATVHFAGGRLDVSDFTTLGEAYDVRLRQTLRRTLRREVLVDWSSEEDAVRRVVLEFTLYNPRAILRRYLPAFVALASAGYLLRLAAGPRGLGVPTFDHLAPVAFSATTVWLLGYVGELLSNDLKHLWVVRVYLLDLGCFARVLLVKYAIAHSVVVAAASCFLATYGLSPIVMLVPAVSSPAVLLSVFVAVLASLALVGRSRHRDPSAEVRVAAAPTLDPLVQLLLLPVLLSGLVSSATAAVAVALIAGGTPAGWIVVAAPASVALSHLLIRPLSEVLADRISKTNLHF